MFLISDLLFLYVETPLHAGAGAGLGAVDLPIQRERVNGYPMVQATGLKGALRNEAEDGEAKESSESKAVFGPRTAKQASDHAGALSAGDARLLLFPVRSLKGVFAWTTSLDLLHRFQREALSVGVTDFPALPEQDPARTDDSSRCYVSGNGAADDNAVVLEEFTYLIDKAEGDRVKAVASWLADHALPQGPQYLWWRNALKDRLVVLPGEDLRDFVQNSTEVMTRVRLDRNSKTVEKGALWTEEHLPSDTLLFAPMRASRLRTDGGPREWQVKDPSGQAEEVRNWVKQKVPTRVQLGGDETVGRGQVALRWWSDVPQKVEVQPVQTPVAKQGGKR